MFGQFITLCMKGLSDEDEYLATCQDRQKFFGGHVPDKNGQIKSIKQKVSFKYSVSFSTQTFIEK